MAQQLSRLRDFNPVCSAPLSDSIYLIALPGRIRCVANLTFKFNLLEPSVVNISGGFRCLNSVGQYGSVPRNNYWIYSLTEIFPTKKPICPYCNENFISILLSNLHRLWDTSVFSHVAHEFSLRPKCTSMTLSHLVFWSYRLIRSLLFLSLYYHFLHVILSTDPSRMKKFSFTSSYNKLSNTKLSSLIFRFLILQLLRLVFII